MSDEELIKGLRVNALWVTTHDAADRIEELLSDLSTAKAGLLEIHRIVPLHPAGDIALATLKTIKGDDKC